MTASVSPREPTMSADRSSELVAGTAGRLPNTRANLIRRSTDPQMFAARNAMPDDDHASA
jgi:hypothetical protein